MVFSRYVFECHYYIIFELVFYIYIFKKIKRGGSQYPPPPIIILNILNRLCAYERGGATVLLSLFYKNKNNQGNKNNRPSKNFWLVGLKSGLVCVFYIRYIFTPCVSPTPPLNRCLSTLSIIKHEGLCACVRGFGGFDSQVMVYPWTPPHLMACHAYPSTPCLWSYYL